MKKYLFLFSIVLLFASCGNNEEEVVPTPQDETKNSGQVDFQGDSAKQNAVYDNKEFGYSIQTFGGSLKESDKKDRIILFPFNDGKTEHRSIMVYAHTMNKDEYKKYYEALDVLDDGTVLSTLNNEKEITFAGHKAYQYVGGTASESQLDIYLVIGKKYNYEIYFDAKDSEQIKMLKTFTIIE